MKQLVFDISPAPAPTLESFVVGSNGELRAALRGLLAGTVGERFLYVWGGSGCGKSHLLVGFVAAAQKLGLRACCVKGGAEPCHADEAVQCDVVAVDDVPKLDSESQGGLFDLYNRMRDGSGILLTSGPYAPMHLQLRADLATRLGQGLVYQVHCLSDDAKQGALITHAQARGFALPVDVATYLLRKWKRDLPSLMVVLDALDRYSLEVKRPITIPLAREVLQHLPRG
jgi:DnaA family protein